MERIKLTMDRSKWGPREVLEDLKLGRPQDDSRFIARSELYQVADNGRVLMCCVGLMAEQCGVPLSALEHRRIVAELDLPGDHPFMIMMHRFMTTKIELDRYDVSLELVLYMLNDAMARDESCCDPQWWPLTKELKIMMPDPDASNSEFMRFRERMITAVAARQDVDLEWVDG